METRCRLCAECYEDQLSILNDVTLASKIFQLYQLKIDVNDRLPTTLCHICHEMVEKIWEFSTRVQKAQLILTDLVNSSLTSNNEAAEVEFTFVDASKTEIEEFPLLPEQKSIDTATVNNKVTNNKLKKVNKKKNKNAPIILKDFQDVTKSDLVGWESYEWNCCDCQQTLPSSEDLREHYSTIHGSSTRYNCIDCPKVYSKYTTFIAHVKVHRVKLKFCCDVCYKWFQSVDEQEKHRSLHGDERPFSCNTCGKRFRMQSALLVHARSHLPAELKNRYPCDQCPKRFGTKPNLMAHKRIHTGIRNYTCDQCGKSFVQKGNLDNHLLTHTAARPFECNTCGKTFKTLIRLKKHGSVHSGLKPHQCDVCGRQFRERGTLKEHHRIHTGAMPFTCEFCGKCFRFKGVLTTHRRQHTGERPYSCNECQHHFTNWPNYNKHMKRRHGINTSVTCRTQQDIPPTGMPHRNPPGTVLAPPQPVVVQESFVEPPTAAFYPVLSLYNIPEEFLQPRV